MGRAETLFVGDYLTDQLTLGISNYDVSADGQRFLMVSTDSPDGERTTISLAKNWFEELTRLAPTN